MGGFREFSLQSWETGGMDAAGLIDKVRSGDPIAAEAAARALRGLAQAEPEKLAGVRTELLRLAFAADDLRVRWNLIQVVGELRLTGRHRAAALDWLFERLRDASSLTRTWALQALADLSEDDAALRARVSAVAEQFAENGTAALRARARKILASHSSRGAKAQ